MNLVLLPEKHCRLTANKIWHKYMNFSINDIPSSTAKRMIDTSVWQKECTVSIDRLKLLKISHYNFDNQISIGHLIVLDKVSQAVLNIFKELLILKFPIHSMMTIEEFGGNDELSMEANNSTAFNFRYIAGTKKLSLHSYGLAIDINPLQNPYIIIHDDSKKVTVFPTEGTNFLNRHNQRTGMVEPIIKIFEKYGFNEWGGDWNTPIDYHHFQIPRHEVDKLII